MTATAGPELFAQLFEQLRGENPRALALLQSSKEPLDRDGLARLAEGFSRRFGTALRSVVAVHTASPVDLVVRVLGTWMAGGVPLLLDSTLPEARARELAASCGAQFWLEGDVVEGTLQSSGLEPQGDPPSAACALLKLTSGSTGEVRAVQLSADALAAGLDNIVRSMGLEPGDRNLVTIPLSHSYGFDNIVLGLLGRGLALVCVDDLLPRPILERARVAGASVWPSVPAQLSALARTAADAGGLGAVRLVLSAGAALPLALRGTFATRFGLEIANFYGSTECGGICFEQAPGEAAIEGRVGTPLAGVRLSIDEADVEGFGRVVVHSRSVALGFHGMAANDLAGEGAVLAPETFRTGDLGRLDDEGRLHLAGRLDDLVNVGGRKVRPALVERILREIAAVRDVAVLGEERAPGRAELRAWVEAGEGLSMAEIMAHCRERLAPHERPRRIEILPELPRDSRGKLNRDALRARP